MQRIAFAQLDRPATPRRVPWRCVVEVLALDGAGTDGHARYLVSTRQGELQGGILHHAQDAALTAQPTTLERAKARARDFVQRRMAQGEQLTDHHGLGDLGVLASNTTMAAPAAFAPAVSVVPPAIAQLLTRLEPNSWKLLPPARRSRTVWRLAEHADAGLADAGQTALRRSVPRLIDLLGTGDDLLDYVIACACARLGDAGAAVAMQQLSARGRSPATRRIAAQAHWLLLDDAARQQQATQLDPHHVLDGAPAEAWPRLAAAPLAEQGALARGVADLYDISLAQPLARAHVLQLARDVPLASGSFQALRVLYKHAELRRDTELLAALHQRFDSVRSPAQQPREARNPRTGARIQIGAGVPAYTRATRQYLRLRTLRQLRRWHEGGHRAAPALATELLLALDPAAALHYSMTAARLLLPRLPGLHVNPRGTHWYSATPVEWGQPLPTRVEGLPELWDAAPQAALRLCLQSRHPAVQAVFARVLQDHGAFLLTQPVALRHLLQSAFLPTANMAFEVVRAHLDSLHDAALLRPWLMALLDSACPGALEHALLRIATTPGLLPDAALTALLLLHSAPRARDLGRAQVQAMPAAALNELLNELLGNLLALPGDATAQDALGELSALLQDAQGPLHAAARGMPTAQVSDLLTHPLDGVVHLGVDWLLLHGDGALHVPPGLLSALLQSERPAPRAAGVRLLASLPEHLLHEQRELVRHFVLHPHAEVRAAIRPAVLRLIARDAGFAAELAQDLHAALFAAGDEGMKADALALLTHELADHAPGRDASAVWRALHAQSRAAKSYGAWALAALPDSAFSWRQLALLGKHEDARARSYSIDSLSLRIGAGESVDLSPKQVAELLPLAESRFDDAQRFAQTLFIRRLTDASLDVPTLIDWIDHPLPWLQSAGRARLTRQLGAEEKALVLERLSEHPGASAQLFLTQWLLEMPAESGAARAQRLAGLQGFFISVLSRVHASRVAKNRITAFLRQASVDADCARVVADIFLRQVVTSSLTDKPQYIAALRDIAQQHPHIELPFVQPQAVARRGNAEKAKAA